MARRIAINGFGRIGRGVLRAWLTRPDDLEIVAVNDLGAVETLAHLLRFDSLYGRLTHSVVVEDGALVIGDRRIAVLSQPDPAQLPWDEFGIDVVIESTGRFTKAVDAEAHLRAGAGRVLVSAPSAGSDVTVVMGVNDDRYDPAAHRIVSNGSCTTNALAPIAKILNDAASIEHGFVTTVHAYTQDQMLVDNAHRDLRRARAAALNIVPTSTGAAKAIGLVIPELDGKLSGDALRVPVPVGSIVEINATVANAIDGDELLGQYTAAAEGPMNGVLRVSHDPLVSSDIVGDSASAILDAPLIRVSGSHVKVVAWYDNEWGFSQRMLDTAALLAR